MKCHIRLATGILVGAAASAILASTSNASLIASDPFGGAPIALTSESDGTGWQSHYVSYYTTGSSSASVAATMLTSPDSTATSTGSLEATGSAGADSLNNRSLASSPLLTPASNSVGQLYVAVLVQLQNPASTGVAQLLVWDTTDSNSGIMAQIGTNGSSSYWGFEGGAGEGIGSPTWQPSSTSLSGTTTLLVFELNYDGGAGHDSMSLYVNPTSTSAGPSVTLSSLSLPQVQYLGFQVSGASASSNESLFSALEAGNSLADVGIVPEPATLALLCMPTLALLKRRRPELI